jgi:hypothetical protein
MFKERIETELKQAKFYFEDLVKDSRDYGSLAEISRDYFRALDGFRDEDFKTNLKEVFNKLRMRSRYEFFTNLWLFYDAFVYGKTMEILGDNREAVRGYRECLVSNPHTDLAHKAKKLIQKLQ